MPVGGKAVSYPIPNEGFGNFCLTSRNRPDVSLGDASAVRGLLGCVLDRVVFDETLCLSVQKVRIDGHFPVASVGHEIMTNDSNSDRFWHHL
jgi:hypothetical protein